MRASVTQAVVSRKKVDPQTADVLKKAMNYATVRPDAPPSLPPSPRNVAVALHLSDRRRGDRGHTALVCTRAASVSAFVQGRKGMEMEQAMFSDEHGQLQGRVEVFRGAPCPPRQNVPSAVNGRSPLPRHTRATQWHSDAWLRRTQPPTWWTS